MRSVQKIRRFACCSLIFFTCLISNVAPKDARNENYKGRRGETNRLTHFQITAPDTSVLKQRMRATAASPLVHAHGGGTDPHLGVRALHVLPGTCAPPWHPVGLLQLPPRESLRGRAGQQSEDLAAGLQEHPEEPRTQTRTSGPCRTGSPLLPNSLEHLPGASVT